MPVLITFVSFLLSFPFVCVQFFLDSLLFNKVSRNTPTIDSIRVIHPVSKPKGRGLKLTPSPVSLLANQLSLPSIALSQKEIQNFRVSKKLAPSFLTLSL